jgi:hypothetical protein
MAGASTARRGGEAEAGGEAGGRAGRGDEEVGARVGRLVGEFGDAAEQPERDAVDPQAVVACGESVGQLVGEQ